MRILYITPVFQHPAVRGSTRCYHFTRLLSKRHAVTLLSLRRSEIPSEAMNEMGSCVERMHLFDALEPNEAHTGNKTGAVSFFKHRRNMRLRHRQAVWQMRETFLRLVQEETFDVVLFHGKSVFSVVEDWSGLPLVMDFCDATSMRIREHLRFESQVVRPALFWRYLRVKQLEKKMVRKTPHVAFVSCRDRNAIVGMGNTGGRVVPIGVDSDFWKPTAPNADGNTIVFTGVMDYRPNDDAARYLIEKILPLVRPQIPDLKMFIVGRNPSPLLREKAKNCKGVTVTGFVEDIRPYIERAALYVAPLRYASGVQNKVLEALAMKAPVLCTSIVAAGLNFDDQDSSAPVRIADGAGAFAKEIITLLGNPDECRCLGVLGRAFVQEHFNWRSNAEVLENMCLEAAAR